MTKIENKILDFLQKNIILIGFIGLTFLAIMLRVPLMNHTTSDYSFFLTEWIKQLKEAGGIAGIGKSIGEYNVPYMLFLAIISQTPFYDLYEIKLFSIIFEFFGAFAVSLLVTSALNAKFLSKTGLFAYAAMIFNPIVFINSAYWGQCDFIYVSFLVMCVYFLSKEKHLAAMVMFSLAFIFKLQAIFFLPAIIIYYFCSRKMKFTSFFAVPIIYVAAALPAIFMGRNKFDTLTIYLQQTSLYSNLTKECPNLYCLMPGEFSEFKLPGIILTLCVLALALCYLMSTDRFKSSGLSLTRELVLTATWGSMVCIYFLPSMHERYTFIVCIFSVILAVLDRKSLWTALGINVVSLLSYAPYLFRVDIVPIQYLSIANLVFLAVLTLKLFGIDEKISSSVKPV